MANDIRYAIRTLVRSPGFALVALLTLALGIGANTAMFSLVRAVFLAPLPFPDAERLVLVTERRGTSGDANLPISGHEYVAWQEENRLLEGIALFRGERLTLTGRADAVPVDGLRVSEQYFPVLQIQAALGQVFTVSDHQGIFDRVAVLSDGFWRRRFGSDPKVLGERLVLDDQAFTVIGVLPPLPPSLTTDVWLPLDVRAEARAVGRHNLHAIGRLHPGVSLEEAQAGLESISADLAGQLADENTDHHAHVAPLRESLVGEFRPALLLLLAAVGLILLIACANVANLLLTRTAGRQQEIAVRAALGASRLRLTRQLLTESILLAALGGAAGLVLAAWIMDLLPRIPAVRIPLLETARLDWRTFAAAAGLSLVTGIVAGVAPALRFARQAPGQLYGANRSTDERGRRKLGSFLVTGEVALTLILLIGVGLMVNSFVRLVSVDPGFDADGVLVVPVDLPGSRYPQAHHVREFYGQVLARLHQLPGVVAAGAISHLPLGGSDNWMRFSLQGRPVPPSGGEPNAPFRVVTPDYFRALGIPLRRGRFFRDGDARVAIPVIRWFPQQPSPPGFDAPQPGPAAIVSETAARRFWPNEDPLGKRIRIISSPDITIVGVVGDIRHNGLDQAVYPHIYLPHNQEPWSSASIVVKTTGEPLELAAAVRDQVRALDASLPTVVQPMSDVVSASVGRPRFYVLLIGIFGGVAVGLAVIGIFGLVSHVVARRTVEIGIRLALGAQPAEVRHLVIGQGMRPVVAGLVVGTAGALAFTRLIEDLLFGVRATDPLTFIAVVALLTTVALLACWVPARRASRIDPVVALRAE